MTRRAAAAPLLRALEEHGLLLLQDRALANAVTAITGESLRGSWWSHPRAHDIFQAVTALADHPDVVATKLVAGKVTFVHRRLWAALAGVAVSEEPWQREGLSPEARRLWGRLRKEGSVAASGPAARELEGRLLVRAKQIHTETGAHRLELETWSAWARRVRCRKLPSEAARRLLEEAVERLGAPLSALPWPRATPDGSKRSVRSVSPSHAPSRKSRGG
jgi:hypothetical protein